METTANDQPDENARQPPEGHHMEPEATPTATPTLRQDIARMGLYFGLASLLFVLGLAGLTYRLNLPVEPPGNAGAPVTPPLSIATPTALLLPTATTAASPNATQAIPAPTRTLPVPVPTAIPTVPVPTATPTVSTPIATPSP